MDNMIDYQHFCIEPLASLSDGYGIGKVSSPREFFESGFIIATPSASQPVAEVSFQSGDIVLTHPESSPVRLFSDKSVHNSLFLTNQCNLKCAMCAQPPSTTSDLGFWFEVNRSLIPLLPTTLASIGMTGGEPTLLGRRLAHLLQVVGLHLPETRVHLLTNAVALTSMRFSKALVDSNHHVSFGVPLHSDYHREHDFICGREGSFHSTIEGLYNLASYGAHIEIRVIVQRANFQRLPQIAEFIFRNLPFVEYTVFMGLEMVGLAASNPKGVWVAPPEYTPYLTEAVSYLSDFRMNTSIYNFPLCVLPSEIRSFSMSAITEWKRSLLDDCEFCDGKELCGGLFRSSEHYLRPYIRPI